MSARQFPLRVVLSLTTGILLCEFGDLHEFAEWVLGHPVFSHEFADRATNERMREAVFKQHPRLRDVPRFEKAEGESALPIQEQLDAYVLAFADVFGQRLPIYAGSGTGRESPLETIQRVAGDKPVLVIVADVDKAKPS